MSESPQPATLRDNAAVRLVLRAGSQIWANLAMPLLAIVLALIAGAVVIILTSALQPGKPMDFGLPLRAYGALLDGSLGSENGRTSTLVQAAPLMLAGLGIGLGFKAGLFNIGGRGQFLIGAVASVAAAQLVRDSGPWIAIPVAVVAGALAGAA